MNTPMKNKIKLPFLRTENLVVKELPNEVLIYDLENNKAFCLNETARFIMDECNGTSSIDEALESLNRKMKSKIDEDMIWMVIDQFKKSNFLQRDYVIPVQTSRLSRRKILQTAAALGIALPIVTSLIAPISAHAQSNCVGDQGVCSDQGDPVCCPGTDCLPTDFGQTGFQCLGCIKGGQPCQFEGGARCCPPFICGFAPNEAIACIPNIG